MLQALAAIAVYAEKFDCNKGKASLFLIRHYSTFLAQDILERRNTD